MKMSSLFRKAAKWTRKQREVSGKSKVGTLSIEPVIIEKFADCAEVSFAIVLLSADDEGRSRDASSDPVGLNALQLPTNQAAYGDLETRRFTAVGFGQPDRWTKAHEILRESPNAEFYFSYASALVPRGCLEIWLAQIRGRRPRMEVRFVTARDELNRALEACPEDACLLSVLGIIDADLGHKEEAIREAKQAAELLPISKDAWEGPRIVSNLAVVFAWTNKLDLAFQQLAISVNTHGGVSYGELKLDPAWDPLRNDPRFEKILAELAPKE